MLTSTDTFLLGWVLASSLYAFGLFGWDKALARRGGKARIAEIKLLVASALGGWAGGLAGMIVFRHKTAKGSFQLKLAIAFLIWAGLIFAYWKVRRSG